MRRRYMGGDGEGFVDAFRAAHPHAAGQYSYWSQRARNRPRNRGLRLDYFLLSAPLVAAEALVDVQILTGLEGSDHAPVLMTLRLDRLARDRATTDSMCGVTPFRWARHGTCALCAVEDQHARRRSS